MRVDLMGGAVIGAILLSAAAMQDLAPVTELLPVKPFFLTAVALYMALTRPAWQALTLILWAGAFTDLLGGTALMCTPLFLLLIYGIIRIMKRVFTEAGILHGILLTAMASALQMVWIALWGGGWVALLTLRTWVLAGCSLPMGLFAGLVIFTLCGAIDLRSGIISAMKEGNDILWTKADR